MKAALNEQKVIKCSFRQETEKVAESSSSALNRQERAARDGTISARKCRKEQKRWIIPARNPIKSAWKTLSCTFSPFRAVLHFLALSRRFEQKPVKSAGNRTARTDGKEQN